jgi:hypothetical protein
VRFCHLSLKKHLKQRATEQRSKIKEEFGLKPEKVTHLRFLQKSKKVLSPLAGIGANVSKNALDFPPPFQGEGRGGDGADCVISAS